MKHITLILLISVALIACKKKKEGIHPSMSPLTESVYASVTVKPDSFYDVYASVSGILNQTYVTEGDLVTAGQSLVQITNTMPKLNAENAKLTLQQAQLNAGSNSSILSNIEDEIKTAQLKLANDKLNYVRLLSLWKKNIGSKSQLDAQQLMYETSQTQVKMLQEKLARTRAELKTALGQASLQYQSAANNSKDFLIQSKMNGKVYSINQEDGEIVNPQMPIATIGSRQNFIIEMLIDEIDITKLELGQTILVSLDAYQKQIFKGTVSKIYPTKNDRTQTFKIEGVFTEKPKKLYPGLTGEGNIIISQKEQVMTIPSAYLTADGMVLTDTGLVAVSIGLQSMELSEILGGIDSATTIYKPE